LWIRQVLVVDEHASSAVSALSAVTSRGAVVSSVALSCGRRVGHDVAVCC